LNHQKKNEGLELTLSNDRLRNEGLELTLSDDWLKNDRLEPTLLNDRLKNEGRNRHCRFIESLSDDWCPALVTGCARRGSHHLKVEGIDWSIGADVDQLCCQFWHRTILGVVNCHLRFGGGWGML
jgi:hypothetical protein